MHPQEILDCCAEVLLQGNLSLENEARVRQAAWFAWAQKEMGGMQHLQFAFRNNTPIVPPDHCGHPTQLVKRGFIDGFGWKKNLKETIRDRIKLFKWPDGNHWYATLDGEDVMVDGESKWNTQDEAIAAAEKWVKQKKSRQ